MTASPRGYICIARKLFTDDPLWTENRPRTRIEAWIDLIHLAAWKPTSYSTPSGIDRLERGEFVASVRYLAQRWRWSKSACQRFLAFLARPEGDGKAGRIAGQREGHHGMIYRVVNYELYQSGTDESGTPDGTASGTDAGQTRDKEEAVKQSKQRTKKPKASVADSPDVAAVVAHYTTRHPRRSVSAKARALIGRVLASGWSVADVVAAIDGNADDAWHAEKRKHELEYVLRDDKRDGFRERVQRAVPAGPEVVDGWFTPEFEASIGPVRLARPIAA